jgi:hypothetical protein
VKHGMEEAQRLTHVRGAAAVGVYILLSSLFFFVQAGSIFEFSFVSGDEG